MAKQRKNSTVKGRVGERELADVLKRFGWPARRGQQRSGVDQADVIDGPAGWHFECKRTERLNLWAAYEQAQGDCAPGEEPIVAVRRNHSPWLAVVDLRCLLRLIQRQAPRAPAEQAALDEMLDGA